MRHDNARALWYEFLHDRNIYHKFMDEYLRANPEIKESDLVEVLCKELKLRKVDTWIVSMLTWEDTRDGFAYWKDIDSDWYAAVHKKRTKALEKEKGIIDTKLSFFKLLLEEDVLDEFLIRSKDVQISRFLDNCEPYRWVSSAFPWYTNPNTDNIKGWVHIDNLWLEECNK